MLLVVSVGPRAIHLLLAGFRRQPHSSRYFRFFVMRCQIQHRLAESPRKQGLSCRSVRMVGTGSQRHGRTELFFNRFTFID